MWWSIPIGLVVLFLARLVFDQRIGNKLFAAGFLFILAFPFIAKFLTRTMGEQVKTPFLSLVTRTQGGANNEIALVHDPEMNEWQIPIELIIENTGEGEAKNWRLWFSPQDDTTSVVLGAGVARQRAYIRDALTGRYETILDSKGRVDDRVIGPHQSLHLGSASKIVLSGDASPLQIRVALDADHMSSQNYVWELTINKDVRRARLRDIVQNEQDA